MKKIILSKNENYYINNDKSYIIEEGAVISKILFIDDKLLSTEIILEKNDLVFNYLSFLNISSKVFSQTELEIKALEKTILLEYEFNIKKDYINLISQLLSRINHSSIYHIYGKKGYILYALCNLAINNEIDKNKINYEYFNISRSQFYLILANLKNDQYIHEIGKKYILNRDKVDAFFKEKI